MRSHVTEIALTATLATALIGAALGSVRQGQYSLALANLPRLHAHATADDVRAKQNYNYRRGLFHSQGGGYH
jgi:hypothetical protein